jgi:hypothetical protein
MARQSVWRGLLILSTLAAGCASKPYQFGTGWRNQAPAIATASDESCGPSPSVVVASGKPHRLVDGLGWFFGIPSKVLLWDARVKNHQVSEKTTNAVTQYLELNQLPDVCVRVNQYAPGEEWRRLSQNKQVGAGWRYTLGTLNLVGYTLFPGRVFGSDRYNPYTNSVYLYSDVPALGVQAAAYAKDIHQRKHPGTYAGVNELPLVSLWHESRANREAIGYFQATATIADQAESLCVLHPSYGLEVGRSIDGLVGWWPVFQVGGAVVGHVTGNYRAHHLPQSTDAVGEPASATTEREPVEDVILPVSYEVSE